MEIRSDTKAFRIPAWVMGVVGLVAGSCSCVAWSYSTFVTIRERDLVRSMMEQRLDSIEKKEDRMNEKLDMVLQDRRIR